MWMSSQRARSRRLIAPEWKVHYSRDKQTGAKVVFHAPNKTHGEKRPGIDGEEKEEAFEDYVNEEVRLLRHEAYFDLIQKLHITNVNYVSICVDCAPRVCKHSRWAVEICN